MSDRSIEINVWVISALNLSNIFYRTEKLFKYYFGIISFCASLSFLAVSVQQGVIKGST